MTIEQLRLISEFIRAVAIIVGMWSGGTFVREIYLCRERPWTKKMVVAAKLTVGCAVVTMLTVLYTIASLFM